jgi:NAD(P)H-hydrate repair Nnr-like enzyme with NAD(P)H-hydrate epimerase domain
MRIVDIKEMKEIEGLAKENYYFDENLIIENVGAQGASLIQQKILDNIVDADILFLIGKGNNGADGLSIARHLTTFGNRVRAFRFFSEDESTVELNKQAQMAEAYGVV